MGPFCAILSIVASFFLERVDTTDTYTQNHTDAVFVHRFQIPSAVLDSLHGSNECILFVKVHFASLFTVDEVGSLEVFHLAGKLRFEFRSVEVCDRSGTANAVFLIFSQVSGTVLPTGVRARKARNNYSFEFHKVRKYVLRG